MTAAPWAVERREAPLLAKSGGGAFVVNLKVGGRVHRISAEDLLKPLRKRRACCGWHIGCLSVSKVKICARIHSGKMRSCRKCFSANGELVVAEEMAGDPVEDC